MALLLVLIGLGAFVLVFGWMFIAITFDLYLADVWDDLLTWIFYGKQKDIKLTRKE